MKTVLRTQPALFAAETDAMSHVPNGKMLMHCVIIETYEIDEDSLTIPFTLIAALPSELQSNGDHKAATALRKLLPHLRHALT